MGIALRSLVLDPLLLFHRPKSGNKMHPGPFFIRSRRLRGHALGKSAETVSQGPVLKSARCGVS
jgi:hypothetical protein